MSDDGSGIAPADRERVFGRFVRLGKDRGRATGGTGLGLAVVQGIVERHGGRVYFSDPEIGGGGFGGRDFRLRLSANFRLRDF